MRKPIQHGLYVAADGNWGDAAGMAIIDDRDWTDAEYQLIDEERDWNKADLAEAIDSWVKLGRPKGNFDKWLATFK